MQLDTTNKAREIERDLVPEWRLKYLDYKVRIQGTWLALALGALVNVPTGREEETQSHRSRTSKRKPDAAPSPARYKQPTGPRRRRSQVLFPESRQLGPRDERSRRHTRPRERRPAQCSHRAQWQPQPRPHVLEPPPAHPRGSTLDTRRQWIQRAGD